MILITTSTSEYWNSRFDRPLRIQRENEERPEGKKLFYDGIANWVKKGIIMLSSQKKMNTTSGGGGVQRHLDLFSTTHHSQTTDGIPRNKNFSPTKRYLLRADKHTGMTRGE